MFPTACALENDLTIICLQIKSKSECSYCSRPCLMKGLHGEDVVHHKYLSGAPDCITSGEDVVHEYISCALARLYLIYFVSTYVQINFLHILYLYAFSN